MRRNTSGFTLLELLVVVAIIAIIGGAMIAAYDGLESQAAKGVATHSIAAVDGAVRNFTVVERSMPNNVETLLAGDPTALSTTGVIDNQGRTVVETQTATGTMAGNLGTKLAGKFTPVALSAAQLAALNAAGITIGRYIHIDGNGATGGNLDVIEDAAGNAGGATVGPIGEITIPAHAFESPREGSANRGRGYPKLLAVGDEVAVWNAGNGGYNNVKVGAAPGDVLIGFGIGNASTLVGADSGIGGGVGNVRLAAAPFYGDVGKAEFPHFVMLVNVGPVGAEFGKAKLTTVVDARGDFLDEEFAESTGQKQ